MSWSLLHPQHRLGTLPQSLPIRIAISGVTAVRSAKMACMSASHFIVQAAVVKNYITVQIDDLKNNRAWWPCLL